MAVEALKVSGVEKRFGALVAVNGINLSVLQGERRALIGPNGAGKTTFFNLISGTLPLSAGTIQLWGRDVTRLPDWRRVRLGLARTFQRNNLFMSLTTFENVQLAVQRQQQVSYNLLRSARSFQAINEQAQQVLEQVGLTGRGELKVASLSYGEQRQLEIALALATKPSILLLDEPTAGMSLAETGQMVELVKSLPAALTLLIVEHDMDVVFALSDRITVLHYGQVLAEGTPEEVQHNPRVREVYLGEGE
ncbi:MAG: ABC transporter ATP-binding protein [Chloroflexi bacterium]|nr:ABC transporter ATP-binding protein [Chloroflexota bacterium]